jgi:hypothetical protein
MTTADATGDDAAPGKERASPERPEPASPVVSSAWLLRSAAFAASAAGIMGVIVAPGMHGNAGEAIVVWTDRGAAALAYFLIALLITLVLRGALELQRARGVSLAARVALIGGGVAVVAISAPGLRERLLPPLALLTAAAAAIACLAAAYSSARAPHTRAAAGVLLAFAFAAIARLGAWELATRAGETANVRLFGYGRGLATTAVLFEAAGQLLAVTWLGTRSRLTGQLGAFAALVGAGILTWGVARGVHSGAALWKAVLHTALADAAGVPPLDALSTFLVPASMLLALAAAAQPRQVVAVTATMALALVSRGAFDAPLRALCGVVAAQWATLACVDPHSMWRTLIDDRRRRIADG